MLADFTRALLAFFAVFPEAVGLALAAKIQGRVFLVLAGNSGREST